MKKQWLMTLTLIASFGIGPAAAQDTIELTFSTYLPPAYEYVWKPIENFVETVESESNGRVQINVFHSAQLFDAYAELAAVSRGDVDIVNMTGSYASGTVPSLGLFTLPFVFQDVAHMHRALQGGLLGLGMREELRTQHEIVVLGVAPWDPYEFYTRAEPITGKADFDGKIWATTGSTDARAIQLLGGAPTRMASSELYLAFARGVIDATVRPLLTGVARSLYEVMDHITVATFAIDTSILAINRQTWESLPEDIQDIIQRAAAERDRQQFARVKAFIKEAIARYKDEGVTVRRLDDETVAKLREATAPVIEEWKSRVEGAAQYLKLIENTKAK